LRYRMNYAGHEQTFDNLNKRKAKAQNDLNNYLESIKKKYTKLNSSLFRKRQRPSLLPSSSSKAKKTNLQNNNSTPQTDNSLTNNFLQAIAQIRNTEIELQNNINNDQPTILE
ncbi:7315_t:CDS:1, partial [Racocetra persica]